MSLFERIQNKILIEQSTGSTGEQERTSSRKSKGGGAYSGGGNQKVNQNEKKTKYQELRDQRTKYNVLKNKQGVYKPSIASAKAKMGERLTNITKPPNPKAVQQNALNASPGRVKKLNKAIARAARFEPGSGKERTIKLASGKTEVKKFDKDYRTRILDRITKNQEANIDTSKKGRINRMRAGISAKSPTIATKIIGKDGKPQRIPMPGGPNEVDFKTGGKGVNQKGIRTDQAVINRMGRDPDLGKPSKAEIAKARREQEAYDRQVRKNQAKLKTPGGAKYYTGKDTPLNRPVLNRSDFNLQKVYDDLATETGGKDRRKRAKNQPTKQQVQATIDKTYPTKQGKDTRPPRFVKGKDGVVRQYGGGRIPDKSSGAYGSANDRVAVSADKKTRIKAPNYDELIKKNKKIVKKIKNIVKPKPSTSGLYDPFRTKIPKLDPLKPLRIPKLKPSVVTKTATKTKLFPKLMKAASRNPKTALAVGLLGLGTYGAIKNRTAVKNMKKNNLLPAVRGGGNTITTKDRDIDLFLQTDSSRK